jgi:hypothetical protein
LIWKKGVGEIWNGPMDCRTALEILDCDGGDLADLGEAEVYAAKAHLAECPRCLAISEGRRQLDRNIGRVMRGVDVPAGAQERLITKLVALESGSAVAMAAPPASTAILVSQPGDAVRVTSPKLVSPARRWTPRLVPVAACLAVAAIGFFSVIWWMAPRWTTAEVRQQLARIDFTTLETLRDFGGDPKACQIPNDPGWQKLDWTCHKIPKGWPAAGRNQFAVYGFTLPGRQRHAVRGLLAVIPWGQMRSPPEDQSLLTAQFGEYLSAQIGESVSVAWTENNLVYVCVVEGGEESLSTLRQILGPSAA